MTNRADLEEALTWIDSIILLVDGGLRQQEAIYYDIEALKKQELILDHLKELYDHINNKI